MKNPALKILFDANPIVARRTGVGYYTAGVIQALADQYPDMELVGYYYNFLGRKPRPSEPTAPNIVYKPIYAFPGPAVNLLRRLHILLPVELLTFTKADFIFYPNFLGLASLFKTPSANVVHDLTYVDLPEYVARKNLSDLQHFIPDNIRRANFLVTVSAFGKRRMHEELGVADHAILVTPIPPSPPKQLPKRELEHILRDELHIPGKYFLTLSTVEPRKNVLGMFDAFLGLPEALQKEYTLVVTGAIGWNCEAEVARLAELKKSGKNVVHLGYVTDVQKAALYQDATFYTSASHYEGFGMTPLEAMSYGTPCALSDIPVFKEVAGNAVLYFDKDKPEAIAAAWQRLLRDAELRKRLGTAGQRQAASFKWSDVAESLYNRITKTLEHIK
jgi:alpha-1,3-rhamnosyl/mannosyltransferase